MTITRNLANYSREPSKIEVLSTRESFYSNDICFHIKESRFRNLTQRTFTKSLHSPDGNFYFVDYGEKSG